MRTDSVKKYVIPNIPYLFILEQYIRNQLQEDYTDDQMSIKEYIDPFTGQPVKEGK